MGRHNVLKRSGNKCNLLWDIDAKAYSDVIELSDCTKNNALNELVKDLKTYGIWDKCIAIYPFISDGILQARDYQHKFNLKNPIDSDSAFRLSFGANVVHSENGSLPDGTSGSYSNTHIDPSIDMTLHNTHISFYNRTSSLIQNYGDFGCLSPQASDKLLNLAVCWNGNPYTHSYQTAYRPTTTVTYAIGLNTLSKTNSTTLKLYQKNNICSPISTGGGTGLPNNLYLFGIYIPAVGGSSKAVRQCSFASAGSGLSDTEASNFNTLVQNYQTNLSRNV